MKKEKQGIKSPIVNFILQAGMKRGKGCRELGKTKNKRYQTDAPQRDNRELGDTCFQLGGRFHSLLGRIPSKGEINHIVIMVHAKKHEKI